MLQEPIAASVEEHDDRLQETDRDAYRDSENQELAFREIEKGRVVSGRKFKVGEWRG